MIGYAKSISHLLFAVDILCFTMTTQKSFWAIHDIISDFSSFIGLIVNMVKNYIILSAFVANREGLLQILGFPETSLPLKY